MSGSCVGVNLRLAGKGRVNAKGRGPVAAEIIVGVSGSGNRVANDFVVVALIRDACLVTEWGATAGDIRNLRVADRVVHDLDVSRGGGRAAIVV